MPKENKLGCSHPRLVRRQRSTVLDALMYRFGRYPWQCRLCGCRVYFPERKPRGDSDGIHWHRGPASETTRLTLRANQQDTGGNEGRQASA